MTSFWSAAAHHAHRLRHARVGDKAKPSADYVTASPRQPVRRPSSRELVQLAAEGVHMVFNPGFPHVSAPPSISITAAPHSLLARHRLNHGRHRYGPGRYNTADDLELASSTARRSSGLDVRSNLWSYSDEIGRSKKQFVIPAEGDLLLKLLRRAGYFTRANRALGKPTLYSRQGEVEASYPAPLQRCRKNT